MKAPSLLRAKLPLSVLLPFANVPSTYSAPSLFNGAGPARLARKGQRSKQCCDKVSAFFLVMRNVPA